MKIRRARLPGDLPALLEMARRFLSETSYAGVIAFVPEQVENLMQSLAEHPDRLLLVSEDAGSVTGMIGFLVYPHPISGERTASEIFWWSHKAGSGLRLLRAAEAWAESRGAVILQMIAPTEQVGKIYRHFGYAPVETLWQRRRA